ncbi:MAG TPA: ABC transporter permease [Gaiella sp.]|nr:ABC transporter permease [Gaiella sp.]
MIAHAGPSRYRRLALIGAPRTVAVIGIALGLGAVLVALPPFTARDVWWPAAIGVFGIAAGIWATTRGAVKLGIIAIVVNLIGITLGIAATQSAAGNLDLVFLWSALIAATLRYATPLTFAALGGLFSERSGVVNIGLEGDMLMGAFFGFWGADVTGRWELGLCIAVLAGAALALVHAFFCIHLRADQIVIGTAINFLALGITGYLFVDIYGEQGTPTDVPKIPDITIPGLEDVPFFGPAFGQLNLMIWLSFVVLIATWLVIFKTPIGLRIRSVGEHPRAADTVGISVYGIRYGCVIVSGALAALGGAYLSLGVLTLFDQNLTGGRGFIALAALIFGNWRPFGTFAAALLFGFSTAFADRVDVWFAQGSSAPLLFNALPYILTIIAVAGVIGRSVPPAADGRPYIKG